MFAAAAVPRSGTGPATASRGVHTCKHAKGQLMEHIMQTALSTDSQTSSLNQLQVLSKQTS
jgi:hypothetical protein